MTTIVIRCLGAFEVTLDAQAVTAFPTDKIRALLAYLALTEAQPHRRELLAALFWPEWPQAVAMTNVRVALYRLRETLEKAQPDTGDALLLTTRQTLQLNRAHLSVDVHTFQKLLATCATHAHAHLVACDDCLNRFAQAVTLYRGELLAGLGLADAPAFEEWLLLQRETLHQQALGALHTLVQMHEQRGDEPQVAYYAQRQLALDPSREEAHRQLMRSLARRGLHSEAFAQFESCRRLLWEDLGVAPDLETLALVEQIRAGEFDKVTRRQEDKKTRRQEELVTELLPVSLSPPLPASPTPGLGWNEAPQATKLYGRQSELSEVARWLVYTTGAPAARLVAILGMGGIGKTTLAAAIANGVAHQFEVVVWRSLLNAPPLDEVLQGLLQRLPAQQPLALPGTVDGQLALLLDCLRQRRCLLVLDNVESILQADGSGEMRPDYAGYAQLLKGVVEQKHQSCLLLTSRERPQGLARWEEDTPLVRTLTLEGLDSTAATAMLNARGLTGQRADATALVARYSGNPLALKLVAQTVQELFAGDIGSFLAVEAPIFDDIRTVLDQQFARLSPLEQELLLWLAVERAPVTAVTLRANLVQPPSMPRFLEALRSLQRRSLLESTGAGFTLQNVVIEYLTERLVERVCEEIADDTVPSTSSVTQSPPHGSAELAERLVTPPPHNLPSQLTPFVGRSQELASILQQLADPNVRLLTLLGAGGMGKTRLAVETAQGILDFRFWILDSDTPSNPKSKIPNLKFPDGLFFVSLAPISRVSELAISVAAAVGLNLTGGDPQQMVLRFLQDKCLLLILDNFEHLLASDTPTAGAEEGSAARWVAELLQVAPALKILVTSREKLNLQGEQSYPIHGLEMAQTTTLAAAEASTAVRLFVQSARRVHPSFALNVQNLPALLRICQVVEGMPLGLELAAAWVTMLTLDEIAEEIEKSLDFLEVDWPEMPNRQRSMRGVFEWSWRLLSDRERQLLRQLAVFRGGFTRHRAAEEIAGATLRLLTSLVQKSLVRRTLDGDGGNNGRYELHELLRQFAAEQLATLPTEQVATSARHSSFYLAFAAARERRLARNEPKDAALEIQGELDNVRQAWLWAVEDNALSDLSAAAYALRLFYTFTSLEPEGDQTFQLAIVRLRNLSGAQSQGLRSKLLGFQAILQIAQLKHAEAQAAAQEAIAVSSALPTEQRNGEGETFGALALGMVLALQSPGQEARTLLEQAIQLAQQHQSTLTAGQTPIESLYDAEWVARISLRDLERFADNYPAAVAHIQQGVQLCRALGKQRGEMVCLAHLAEPLITLHEYAAAQQACTQGLALARTLNNRWGEAFSLLHLGNATRLLGHYGEALVLLDRAYTIIHTDSDLGQEAMVAGLLGHLYNLLGASEQAHDWFERFLSLLQQFHEPWDEAELAGVLPLALYYQQRGDNAQALHHARRGWQIAQRYGWRQSQAQALLLCGHAQAGLQQLGAAAVSYQQALALYQVLNDTQLTVEAYAGLARIALDQDDLAAAQSHVEAILPILDHYPQAGLDEPFAIYLTCYRVLSATADRRAGLVLRRGYDLLQEYANNLENETLRHSFLENVPVHYALPQAYTSEYQTPRLA